MPEDVTLPMLRLLMSKTTRRKDFSKPSKLCHVGIHWIGLTNYSDEYPSSRL